MVPSPNSAQVALRFRTTVHDEEVPQPFSAINLIPPEFLCYIFTLLVPPLNSGSSLPVIPTPNTPWLNGPWILGGPWVFSQVCSHWCALAVLLPTLWTSITVFTTVSPRELSLLNIQLSRTEVAPLDLHIHFISGTHSPPNCDLFDLFLARLFDSGWLLHATFTTINGLTLPLLEELAFSGSGVSYIENYSFFTDAPALCRLVLRTHSLASTRKITLPWAQLMSYKAFHSDAATHFRDLAGMANIVECDLDFATFNRDLVAVMQLDIVILLSLRRLAISCPLLLNRLIAPALQSLYIVSPVKHVHPFLDCSGCTSKFIKLTLLRNTGPTPEIIALLQQTPGLTALMLDVHSLLAEIVTVLTAQGRLCPALVLLAWADFTDTLDRGAFTGMVVSMRRLHSVMLLAGRRSPNAATRCMCALPGLEVVTMNPNEGVPALAC
ncbi:hypothetical protein K438DRAFT_1864383 [Mycena galopus ATCC 62051]|nr:hypothetical protein K438DRAFT_1864383 [Mycena galopus ATCC 62051]